MKYQRALVITFLLTIIAFHPGPIPITGESGSGMDIPPSLPVQKVLSDAENSKTGEDSRIVKIVVQGQYSFPVVEQLQNNPGFVSKQPGTLTHFRMAEKYCPGMMCPLPANSNYPHSVLVSAF